MQGDYTVFTHLLDSKGVLQGQKDNKPLAGARPTVTWTRGEVLVDVYDIALAPAGAAPAATFWSWACTSRRRTVACPWWRPRREPTEVRIPGD